MDKERLVRGGSTIHQTAAFEPAGLWGMVYRYGVYPLHARIFKGMLAAIATRAVQGEPAAS